MAGMKYAGIDLTSAISVSLAEHGNQMTFDELLSDLRVNGANLGKYQPRNLNIALGSHKSRFAYDKETQIVTLKRPPTSPH